MFVHVRFLIASPEGRKKERMVKLGKGAKVEKNALIDKGEDGRSKSGDRTKRASTVQDPNKRASDVQGRRTSGMDKKRASQAVTTATDKSKAVAKLTRQSKQESCTYRNGPECCSFRTINHEI